MSTRENAAETRKLLGTGIRPVLLTSDFHMYRAFGIPQGAGLQAEAGPYPEVCKRASGWRGRWPAFLDLCVESAKIGYDKLRGWI